MTTVTTALAVTTRMITVNNSDHIGIATADTKSDNDARNSENHNDNDSSDTNIGEMSK